MTQHYSVIKREFRQASRAVLLRLKADEFPITSVFITYVEELERFRRKGMHVVKKPDWPPCVLHIEQLSMKLSFRLVFFCVT